MALPVDSAALLAADGFDLGHESLVRARDREDHALVAFDLFRRGDAQAIVGDADLSQKLDRQVSEGRVREEDDDARHACGVLNPSGPNLRCFHVESLSERIAELA